MGENLDNEISFCAWGVGLIPLCGHSDLSQKTQLETNQNLAGTKDSISSENVFVITIIILMKQKHY